MQSITKFANFLYENWTPILVLVGVIIGIVKKTIDFFTKTDEERIEIVKEQIRASMLKMITDAEIDFEDWNKAGEIKRSQVIKQIYDEYPILEKVADQQSLINWVDMQINDSLKILRKIVKENSTEIAE